MITNTDDRPTPPEALSDKAATLWRAVVDGYLLSAAELVLLAEACHALDRANQARSVIAAEGVVVIDRYGSPKQHPACDVEARARQFLASAIRQLGVKVPEPAKGTGRPQHAARAR